MNNAVANNYNCLMAQRSSQKAFEINSTSAQHYTAHFLLKEMASLLNKRDLLLRTLSYMPCSMVHFQANTM